MRKDSTLTRLLIANLLMLILASQSFGATNMYLNIPGIDGESTDLGHEKEIEVLAWSWGLSNSTDLQGGITRGATQIGDLSITKYIDKSSPNLMLRCAEGKSIAEAILTLERTWGGSKPYVFMKITLRNLIVKSVSTGGSSGDDRMTENITLNFTRILVEYTPVKADGSPDAPVQIEWDVLQGGKI